MKTTIKNGHRWAELHPLSECHGLRRRPTRSKKASGTVATVSGDTILNAGGYSEPYSESFSKDIFPAGPKKSPAFFGYHPTLEY